MPENAASARDCEGRPLPHGHPYSREHVVYPTWYDQGNGRGPDRLCDEPACFCMSHECDCDVCTGLINAPKLRILIDSHEYETDLNMSHTIDVYVPAQLRKWAVRENAADTQGAQDLMDACKATGLGSSNKSSTIPMTNAALGALLGQARKWLDSDNGNNTMAAKSVLSRHELDYEPGDPREQRIEVKMPKSLASSFPAPYSREFNARKEMKGRVLEDVSRMSWTAAGINGRIRPEALGYLLDKVRGLEENPHPATARAACKFGATYTEPYEKAQRLINGYLGTDEDEDQEPAAVERPALVVIACGGKKSDAPGEIPADERYTGNYFRACLQAAEVMEGPTLILSAKYGLVSPSDEIENYDITWGGKGSIRLGDVQQQVEALGLQNAAVTVLGGERYVKAARQLWPDAKAPLAGGIGRQLSQLALIYGGDALEDDENQGQDQGHDQAGNALKPVAHWSGEFRNIGGLPGRYHDSGLIIWYGGKAGKRNPEPGTWHRVRVIYTGDGRYDLVEVQTDKKLITCKLSSQIHWASYQTPMTAEAPKLVTREVVKEGEYEVPENFIDLAESADTESARKFWTEFCDEYRKTGKCPS